MRSKCESCIHCEWDEYGFGLCKLELEEETCDEAEEMTINDIYDNDYDEQLRWYEARSER